MGGAYGLVLFVFGALVDLAQSRNPDFIPSAWLPAVNLVMTFGIAWLLVAIAVRLLVRALRSL